MSPGYRRSGREVRADSLCDMDRAPSEAAGNRVDRVADILVVIPAHDEEAVVRRGIRSVVAGARRSVRVVVVANGCSDSTVERVLALCDPRVEIIERAGPGKALAIRHGLEAYGGEAVVAVVDADVVLEGPVVDGLVDILPGQEPRIGAPGLRLDLTGCTPLARRYHRTWLGEPHVRAGDIGARGVYAVNRPGLDRLREMPDIIADDGWARARFEPHERVVTAGDSVVRPPRTYRSLVRRRARVILGNWELRRVLPGHDRPAPSSVTARTWRVRLSDAGILGTASWYLVELPARVLARRAGRTGRVAWGKDQSSRGAVEG